jgi:fumarate hydratase class II
MTTHRSEKDSMGAIDVPADKLWGRKPNGRLSIFASRRKKCRSRLSTHWH